MYSPLARTAYSRSLAPAPNSEPAALFANVLEPIGGLAVPWLATSWIAPPYALATLPVSYRLVSVGLQP
jgi:hypothetical protein